MSRTSTQATEAPVSPSAASIVADVRPQLFGIAYRVLGNRGEAEDMVQEAWIRWQNCDRSRVRDAPRFLATTTARLSSNAVQSARARRETYMGAQHDPVDTNANPELAAERAEALEFALRLTLEKLSPSERAAYVLRHAFDYPYERIAEIVQQTQASVRQHVSRARKRLTGGKRAAISPSKHRQLLDAFVAGAQTGDLTALERLFAADVIKGGSPYGRAQIAASPTRNASARSLAAAAPSTGSHDRRGRSQAKAVATQRPGSQRSASRRASSSHSLSAHTGRAASGVFRMSLQQPPLTADNRLGTRDGFGPTVRAAAADAKSTW